MAEAEKTDAMPIAGFMVPRAAVEDAVRRLFAMGTGLNRGKLPDAVCEVLRGALPYLQATQEHRHVHYHVPDGHQLDAVGEAVQIKPWIPDEKTPDYADEGSGD